MAPHLDCYQEPLAVLGRPYHIVKLELCGCLVDVLNEGGLGQDKNPNRRQNIRGYIGALYAA